jgi:hypothetical protein
MVCGSDAAAFDKTLPINTSTSKHFCDIVAVSCPVELYGRVSSAILNTRPFVISQT